MPNHLAGETSPYLLQHQNNPVDWRPWGPEALELARRDQRPIFLSIGYSACHWCHVMEHESFEDERIAALVNERFVAIKVDREERPDLDQIYMNATQMLTGHGGWPMSVFLTPDLKPFYAGTYFPPTSRGGMPGFDQVLVAVHEAWTRRRDEVERMSAELADELRRAGRAAGGGGQLSAELFEHAVNQLARAFDHAWGGFGRAPKFPHPMDLQLLLRFWNRTGHPHSLEMVRTTLDRMAAGGIYDHLGGGFARYSVDARWLVPHFEKMLYDNALLAATYVEAYQATGDENYARVARETIEYVLRDMTDAEGGFYSTEDADSEGEEGKFYVWTPEEIEAVLGEAAGATFGRVYDVTDAGNFEGRNILNLPKTIAQAARIMGRDENELAAELAVSRQKLFDARQQRIRPGKDDKIIVAWNGLMIDALARAAAALGEPRYATAAGAAADFIHDRMQRPDGRLLHTYRRGQAKLDAYLDDYAALANGLVSLYEATFDPRRLVEAARLLDIVLAHFADRAGGGFFFTADDHEQLIARNKDATDNSTPSASALAATALVRLGKLSGEAKYLEAAEAALVAAAGLLEQAPTAMGQTFLALDYYLGPTYELALVGDAGHAETEAARRELGRRYIPHKVVAGRLDGAAGDPPPLLTALLSGKTADSGGGPTLYVCQGYTCQEPARGLSAIRAQLDSLTRR
ncbi:MAG: thioredoxin domain-containing protein [Planctomycetota bacterium]|nr:MAG: thioredoxin domain-containing protein [Planctomycetota bacterium]